MTKYLLFWRVIIMELLLLNTATEADMPISTIIIWAVLLAIVYLCRNMIGRTLFGIGFGILVLFFTIFLIDNYTGHNLRTRLNIDFYDTTLENPKGVAENIANTITEGGKGVKDKLNNVGKDIDDSFNIERENSDSKVWVDKEEVEQTPENEEVDEKETVSVSNKDNFVIVPYTQIESIINEQLSGISLKDKEILKSISPTFKTTIVGDSITVTNDEKELKKNNTVKISLN